MKSRSMGEANPFRVPNCSPQPDPAAQLTVFYAGSVRVFDNVSREKVHVVRITLIHILSIDLHSQIRADDE